MSGLKEIRRRISSVNNTRQITRAMKLVSAAKLRRAQTAAQNGRAYDEHLSSVIRKLAGDLSGEFQHPLLERAETVSDRLVVVVGGDRGLCGPYNANLIKAIEAQDCKESVDLHFAAIGRRAVSSAARFDWDTVSEYHSLPEDVAKWPIEDLAKEILRDFSSKRYQEVVIYYTKFVSALTQKVTREVLLPFNYSEEIEVTGAGADEPQGYRSYSPNPEEILGELIPVVIRTRLRQAGLESKASEHAARMTAMDSATNNANELIDKLRLSYNRARQSSITKELLDIIGGAEAIS